ncbi:MAG: hypothetical protein OXK17_01305 [Thaumarchaeota archaeon]|nr:hypothetical protein [Nitrososphaerota archaeon]
MTMKNAKTILIASLASAVILSLGAIDLAYAINYSNPAGFTEEEAIRITMLAKQVEFLTESIAGLKAENNTASSHTIEYLQSQLNGILAELNPLGFYSHEQYYQEKAKALRAEQASRESSHTSSCDCENEMAWRAGFEYRLWGVTSDTKGTYKYSTILLEEKTSIARVGYFVPDWIRPYAEAFQTPTSGGTIEYDLTLENKNGGLIRHYLDNSKAVLSTSWWNPTQWDEEKYYNVQQYDRVLVEGRAASWN